MLEHMVVTVMESFQDRNLAKLYILKLHILYNSNLNLPQGKTNLPRSNTKTSCFLIGDEVFQLSINMMRSYSGRNLS